MAGGRHLSIPPLVLILATVAGILFVINLRRDEVRSASLASSVSMATARTSGDRVDYSNNDVFPNCKNCVPNYFLDASGMSKVIKNAEQSAMIFLHHNKAAGTTIKTCLSNLRKGKFVNSPNKDICLLSHPGRVQFEKDFASGAVKERTYDIFNGGYAFGVCDLLQRRSCSYFTFLRDPYERIISSYFYCMDHLDQLCGTVDPHLVDIEAWAISQGSYFFNQLLYKPEYCFIDGEVIETKFEKLIEGGSYPNKTYWRRKSVPCWLQQKVYLSDIISDDLKQKMLTHVINHMTRWFVVIGLTSEMETSLNLLAFAYDVPFYEVCVARRKKHSVAHNNESKYTYKNITDHDKIKEELRIALLQNEHVRSAVKEDLAIYEAAQHIFKQQLVSFRKLSKSK